MDYGTGVYSEVVGGPPLARFSSPEEIEANYRWPRVDDWDFSVLPEQVKGREHLPVQGGGSEPFLQYKLLRGEEQAFIDLVENPASSITVWIVFSIWRTRPLSGSSRPFREPS